MAVTGIVNGYNMYQNPYHAGSMAGARAAGTAGTNAAAAQSGELQGAAFGEASIADGMRMAGLPGNTGSGARASGLPGNLGSGIPVAGWPKGAWDGALLGREGELSPEDAADPDAQKKAGRKSSPEECQTCKERKYQDGSDENVSFKAAAHISPEAAGAAVRAHEGEHVSNAYKEASEKGGKVINASVMIHTAICPECGRTYVSGGTTNTTIRYSKEENPYKKAQKAQEAIKLRGKNIDYAA